MTNRHVAEPPTHSLFRFIFRSQNLCDKVQSVLEWRGIVVARRSSLALFDLGAIAACFELSDSLEYAGLSSGILTGENAPRGVKRGSTRLDPHSRKFFRPVSSKVYSINFSVISSANNLSFFRVIFLQGLRFGIFRRQHCSRSDAEMILLAIHSNPESE